MVTDDPPVTGTSFVRCIHQLERLGVAATSLTVSFPRFIDTPALLRHLEAIPHVTLDWPDWTVHRHLRADSVRTALQELLPSDTTVEAVEPLHERRPRRAEAHLRAVFDVTVAVAHQEPTTSPVAV